MYLLEVAVQCVPRISNEGSERVMINKIPYVLNWSLHGSSINGGNSDSPAARVKA